MKAKVCFAMTGLLLAPSLAKAQQACSVTTYEAETMFHSTGGSTTGGWNIWSNGYISTSHNFDGGSKVITVVARGQSAGGAAPHMNVYVDGSYKYSHSVANTDWGSYTFNLDIAAGSHEIRIEFDSDYNQGGQHLAGRRFVHALSQDGSVSCRERALARGRGSPTAQRCG